MRSSLVLLATLTVTACSDASGTLVGGQPQNLSGTETAGSPSGSGSSSGSSSGGGGSGSSSGGGSSGVGASSGATPPPSFAALYTAFFGNANTGGCGSIKATCHQAAGDQGSTLNPQSGFVCGQTAASCYSGMQKATPPLIPSAAVSDVSAVPLWLALYQGGRMAGTSNNMPLVGVAATTDQLAEIKAWLEAGAPNN